MLSITWISSDKISDGSGNSSFLSHLSILIPCFSTFNPLASTKFNIFSAPTVLSSKISNETLESWNIFLQSRNSFLTVYLQVVFYAIHVRFRGFTPQSSYLFDHFVWIKCGKQELFLKSNETGNSSINLYNPSRSNHRRTLDLETKNRWIFLLVLCYQKWDDLPSSSSFNLSGGIFPARFSRTFLSWLFSYLPPPFLLSFPNDLFLSRLLFLFIYL